MLFDENIECWRAGNNLPNNNFNFNNIGSASLYSAGILNNPRGLGIELE